MIRTGVHVFVPLPSRLSRRRQGINAIHRGEQLLTPRESNVRPQPTNLQVWGVAVIGGSQYIKRFLGRRFD